LNLIGVRLAYSASRKGRRKWEGDISSSKKKEGRKAEGVYGVIDQKRKKKSSGDWGAESIAAEKRLGLLVRVRPGRVQKASLKVS